MSESLSNKMYTVFCPSVYFIKKIVYSFFPLCLLLKINVFTFLSVCLLLKNISTVLCPSIYFHSSMAGKLKGQEKSCVAAALRVKDKKRVQVLQLFNRNITWFEFWDSKQMHYAASCTNIYSMHDIFYNLGYKKTVLHR